MDISWKFHDGQQVFSMIKMRSVAEGVFLRMATGSFGALFVVVLVLTFSGYAKATAKAGTEVRLSQRHQLSQATVRAWLVFGRAEAGHLSIAVFVSSKINSRRRHQA